jgi:flagellar biosynthesis GTPase FlhF
LRVSQREVIAVALDTGELACRHQRVLAGGPAFTDPIHQAALEQLRGERRRGREVDVERRPLALRRVDSRMSAAAELTHLFRALKAPAAARALPKLAERAREEQWTYERFAEVLLWTEVSSRESHGGESRIKAARFPARKTLEEFDFTFQRSAKRQVIEHLGQLDFLHARENVVLLGPPGTGKTHLATAWGSAPAWPASASRSRLRPNGSRGWPTPNATTASTPSCADCRSSRCWSSTRWATSRWMPRPPT